MSGKLGMLQSLDDAIAFRFGRLQRPCLDCTGRHRCTEHAFDQYLLQGYKTRYAAACTGALAELDPDSIDQFTQADGMPPTAAIVSAAVTARLREAVASGPVRIELGCEPVVIELYGQAPSEHPHAVEIGESSPQARTKS
jgi:hypothetical protein